MIYSTATSMLDVENTYNQPIARAHHSPPLSPFSCDEFDDRHDAASVRTQKGLREVDAETLIAPILSRRHSTALYDDVTSHSPPRSVSPSSEEEGDEAEGGVRAIRQLPTVTEASTPPQQQKPQQQQQQQQQTGRKKPHQKSLSFTLPSFSLPKNVTFPSFASGGSSSSSGPSAIESMAEKYRRVRSKTLQPAPSAGASTKERNSGFFGRPFERDDTDARKSHLPAKLVRRSSSVGSLTRLSLSRAMTAGSTTSSIGDDSRFLHVHSQTNSRFKAIKDNILAGLPTMPQVTHLHQHLANLNPFMDSGEHSPPPIIPRSPALEALDTVTGDVVVLGGYRGSILRDSATGRRVWIPLKVGFNLRKVDLEVGLDHEDEERSEEKIQPDGMLKSISAVDISRRLFRRLRNNAGEYDRRVHDWGYDWRLSPALTVKKLIKFLEDLPCNKKWEGEDPAVRRKGKGALVIAHSLGGLIVRNAINHRPELFSGVIFAGTPMNCINILGPLKNGDSVLFNSKVFTAQVNFTLRSSYALLPDNGECFVDKNTGEPIPMDFFNVDIWREYGLSPCVSDLPQPSLPYATPLSRLTNASSMLQNLNPLSDSSSKTKDTVENAASVEPQMNSNASSDSPATSTIPKAAALEYLTRTLAETREFRRDLDFREERADLYPPMAVLYAKTTPTVKAARVDGKEGIKRQDVYDDLLFGAGDGVCLARAAMLPEGYKCAKKVAVDRGHISLLGDLEGVGRCVQELVKSRGW